MKNIFRKAIPFGVAFFLSASLHAQITSEIRDYYDSSLVTNDTVHFWVGQGQLHVYNHNQINISASTNTYRVYKSYGQMQSGAEGNFCIYHNDDLGDLQSQCYTPSVFTSANFVTDSGEFNTLVADFNPGTTSTGLSVVRYRFVNMNNTADTATITFFYNVTPVGMAEGFTQTALGQPYPVPSKDVVTIPVAASSSNAVVMITNSVGQTVVEISVSNAAQVSVNVAEWSSGIYFVALICDDAVVARRKITRE